MPPSSSSRGGPGEYTYPNGLFVSDDGCLFVRSRQRVLVYSNGGQPVGTYNMPPGPDVPFVVTSDGTTYGAAIVEPDAVYYRLSVGLVAYGPEGPSGEFLVPPRFDVEVPHIGGPRGLPVPHAAEYVWTMDPWRNLIAGASDEYHFEIARPDGTTLVVEREFDPVPVSDGEHADAVRNTTDFMNRTRGDAWRWDGPPVPHFKPAFVKFMPTRSGELWVLRAGPSEHVRELRWRDTYIIDVFDRAGRFLGEAEYLPEAWLPMQAFATDHGGPFAFVRDEMVLMAIEDESGTIMVKRYRLVLQGEEAP